jgi:hypothetical protein
MVSDMKPDDTLEMACPRKYVENIIIGLEHPLNEHLVKLVGFDFPTEQRGHFRREVRTWLAKIQRLRMKPDSRTGSFKFYYDLLFDYPFGGVEVQNMRTIFDLIGEEHGLQPVQSPQDVVAWLQQFHSNLADRLHKGDAVLDLVPD